MKIAQILPRLESGGTERGVLELAFASRSRGHESIVISGGGRLVEDLRRQGIRHFELPVHLKDRNTHFQLAPQLASLLVDEKVDLVDVHSRAPAWATYFALQSMPKETRPLFVTTCHGLYEKADQSLVMLRGDAVIAVSFFLRDYLRETFSITDENKIQVVQRGVDPNFFSHGYPPPPSWNSQFEAKHSELRGRRLVTLVARLSRTKGLEDFLLAAHELEKRRNDLAYLIVGEAHPGMDSYEKSVDEMRRSLGLGRCFMLGYHSDVKEIMAKSSVVVCPSNDPEPFGRVMLEALSLGVPVAAYDHGGASEILGELFPEGLVAPCDVTGLVDRIDSLLANPVPVRRNESFPLEKMLDSTFSLYEDQIKSRTRLA